MDIKLKLKNNKFIYIFTDAYNFILHEGFRNSDVTLPKPCPSDEKRLLKPKYYSNVKTLLDGLFSHCLLKSDARTLKDMSMDIKHIKKLITELY